MVIFFKRVCSKKYFKFQPGDKLDDFFLYQQGRHTKLLPNRNGKTYFLRLLVKNNNDFHQQFKYRYRSFRRTMDKLDFKQ